MIKVFIATDFTVLEYQHHYYVPMKLKKIIDRYYSSFGELVLCSRFSEVQQVDDKLFDITDKVEKVHKVFDYKEIVFGKDTKRLVQLIEDCNLIIGRLPGIIPNVIYKYSQKLGKPYFSEIMGDAWDSYWNHSFFGKLIAPYMEAKTKSIVSHSRFALYVTTSYLQKKYPCDGKCIDASNVSITELDEKTFLDRTKMIDKFNPKFFSVMTAANVNARAKGHKYVIEAIYLLKKEGVYVKYFLAGDGDQSYLKKVANKYNVQDQIIFCGELSFLDLCKTIDSIDIYIQPSLQEGLPRSVIEAMARACPCVGSNTAGTPELLKADFIFKRKSAKDIVKKLKVISNKDVLVKTSKDNFYAARAYLEPILDQKRNLFFDNIQKELID